MTCSLRQFLTTGVLGRLHLGAARSSVIEALGEPSHWEGKRKLSAHESGIWQYNALDVLFSLKHTIEIMRLGFIVSHEDRFKNETALLAPLVFTDMSPCEIAEYNAFLGYVRAASIPHSVLCDPIDRPIIETALCSVRFCQVLHGDESLRVEHLIHSASFYLYSMSTRKAE
jgi:hypothetical protein